MLGARRYLDQREMPFIRVSDKAAVSKSTMFIGEEGLVAFNGNTCYRSRKWV